MKTAVFRMEFAPGSVYLWEEIRGVYNPVELSPVGVFDSVASARDFARALTPDGYKTKLLNVQAPIWTAAS